MTTEGQKQAADECRETFEREATKLGYDLARWKALGLRTAPYGNDVTQNAWKLFQAGREYEAAKAAEVEIQNDRVRIGGKWFYPPAEPVKAEAVERATDAVWEIIKGYSTRKHAEHYARAVLSALPSARDDDGRAEGLTEDLNQLIRVALTNPGDLRGFIEANYPNECRHYKGRPAVEGKPLNLQTRDELLAHVRLLEAENERLTFEANAGRQAEAEVEELVGALKISRSLTRKYLDMVDGRLDGALITELREIHYQSDAALTKAAQAKAGAV